VVYTGAALLLVVVGTAWSVRADGRLRQRFWKVAGVLTCLGWGCVLAAVFTGNLFVFYAGSLTGLVGLPLALILTVLVYQDRRRTLDGPFWGVKSPLRTRR